MIKLTIIAIFSIWKISDKFCENASTTTLNRRKISTSDDAHEKAFRYNVDIVNVLSFVM